MRTRPTVRPLVVTGAIVALTLMVALPAAAQPDGQTPRTSWGVPDLQGLWTNSTRTPFERPDSLADRDRLTPEEVAALVAGAAGAWDRPLPPGDPGAYNEFWRDPGSFLERTSLIVDPPNGRLPAFTEDGARRAAWQSGGDSWVNRNLSERCLTRGAPRRPGSYNSNFLILQTPGYVVMLLEMMNEVRIIAIDDRPRIDEGIRLFLGDARGHWEGDTLVVEATNFRDDIVANIFNCCPGAGRDLRVVERFTRVDADTIEHRYTVEDATTYTRPFTVFLPMTRTEGPIFEYACHEGNLGLEGILTGARAEERRE